MSLSASNLQGSSPQETTQKIPLLLQNGSLTFSPPYTPEYRSFRGLLLAVSPTLAHCSSQEEQHQCLLNVVEIARTALNISFENQDSNTQTRLPASSFLVATAALAWLKIYAKTPPLPTSFQVVEDHLLKDPRATWEIDKKPDSTQPTKVAIATASKRLYNVAPVHVSKPTNITTHDDMTVAKPDASCSSGGKLSGKRHLNEMIQTFEQNQPPRKRNKKHDVRAGKGEDVKRRNCNFRARVQKYAPLYQALNTGKKREKDEAKRRIAVHICHEVAAAGGCYLESDGETLMPTKKSIEKTMKALKDAQLPKDGPEAPFSLMGEDSLDRLLPTSPLQKQGGRAAKYAPRPTTPTDFEENAYSHPIVTPAGNNSTAMAVSTDHQAPLLTDSFAASLPSPKTPRAGASAPADLKLPALERLPFRASSQLDRDAYEDYVAAQSSPSAKSHVGEEEQVHQAKVAEKMPALERLQASQSSPMHERSSKLPQQVDLLVEYQTYGRGTPDDFKAFGPSFDALFGEDDKMKIAMEKLLGDEDATTASFELFPDWLDSPKHHHHHGQEEEEKEEEMEAVKRHAV